VDATGGYSGGASDPLYPRSGSDPGSLLYWDEDMRLSDVDVERTEETTSFGNHVISARRCSLTVPNGAIDYSPKTWSVRLGYSEI
jgi:hypothetical protein